MMPKKKKNFEMDSDKIIKITIAIAVCMMAATLVAIFCGGIR